MLLDVAATDPAQNVQVFAETKEFLMQGYTGPDKTGDKTADNWLIRSWDDLALPAGKSQYEFTMPLPAGVTKVDVKATLTYKVGDNVRAFNEAAQSFTAP